MTTERKYTVEQMQALQNAYDYFNKTLFGSALTQCILTLSRSRNVYGCFCPAVWTDGLLKKQETFCWTNMVFGLPT